MATQVVRAIIWEREILSDALTVSDSGLQLLTVTLIWSLNRLMKRVAQWKSILL